MGKALHEPTVLGTDNRGEPVAGDGHGGAGTHVSIESTKARRSLGSRSKTRATCRLVVPMNTPTWRRHVQTMRGMRERMDRECVRASRAGGMSAPCT